MSGVTIVAFLVACSPNLLDCYGLNAPTQHFADMGECQATLATLIQEEAQRQGDRSVIMGRCHYLLIEPARERVPAMRAPSKMPDSQAKVDTLKPGGNTAVSIDRLPDWTGTRPP